MEQKFYLFNKTCDTEFANELYAAGITGSTGPGEVAGTQWVLCSPEDYDRVATLIANHNPANGVAVREAINRPFRQAVQVLRAYRTLTAPTEQQRLAFEKALLVVLARFAEELQ